MGVMYVSELSQLFYQGPGGERHNCAMCAAAVSADGAHPTVRAWISIKTVTYLLRFLSLWHLLNSRRRFFYGGVNVCVRACWESIPLDGTQNHSADRRIENWLPTFTLVALLVESPYLGEDKEQYEFSFPVVSFWLFFHIKHKNY